MHPASSAPLADRSFDFSRNHGLVIGILGFGGSQQNCRFHFLDVVQPFRPFAGADADDATRRMHREAGRAVAVQFACAEESPGSAEQDAG